MRPLSRVGEVTAPVSVVCQRMAPVSTAFGLLSADPTYTTRFTTVGDDTQQPRWSTNALARRCRGECRRGDRSRDEHGEERDPDQNRSTRMRRDLQAPCLVDKA